MRIKKKLRSFLMDPASNNAVTDLRAKLACESDSEAIRRGMILLSTMGTQELYTLEGKSRAAMAASAQRDAKAREMEAQAASEREAEAALEAERNRPMTLQEEMDAWLSGNKMLDQYPVLEAYVNELESDLALPSGKYLQKEEVAYCATARGDVVYTGTSEPLRPEQWTGAGLRRTGPDTWEAESR